MTVTVTVTVTLQQRFNLSKIIFERLQRLLRAASSCFELLRGNGARADIVYNMMGIFGVLREELHHHETLHTFTRYMLHAPMYEAGKCVCVHVCGAELRRGEQQQAGRMKSGGYQGANGVRGVCDK